MSIYHSRGPAANSIADSHGAVLWSTYQSLMVVNTFVDGRTPSGWRRRKRGCFAVQCEHRTAEEDGESGSVLPALWSRVGDNV